MWRRSYRHIQAGAGGRDAVYAKGVRAPIIGALGGQAPRNRYYFAWRGRSARPWVAPALALSGSEVYAVVRLQRVLDMADYALTFLFVCALVGAAFY